MERIVRYSGNVDASSFKVYTHDFTRGSQDCNSAFAFRDINTNCVHHMIQLKDRFAVSQSFLIAYSISRVSSERTRHGSTHVSRRAGNKRLADRLSHGREVQQRGIRQNQCRYILTAKIISQLVVCQFECADSGKYYCLGILRNLCNRCEGWSSSYCLSRRR